MKYIKHFEPTIKDVYQIGDILELNSALFFKNEIYPDTNIVQVVKSDKSLTNYAKKKRELGQIYDVISLVIDMPIHEINDFTILRKLSPEEIKEFKSKKASHKYNI